MGELLLRLEISVPLGAVAGALFLLFASRRGPARERRVLGVGLIVAALLYPLFGLLLGAPAARFGVEAIGVALFSAVAIAGMRRWPILLAVGWAAHVVWDLHFHFASGPGFAPAWYGPACVGFDLLVAGFAARPRSP